MGEVNRTVYEKITVGAVDSLGTPRTRSGCSRTGQWDVCERPSVQRRVDATKEGRVALVTQKARPFDLACQTPVDVG